MTFPSLFESVAVEREPFDRLGKARMDAARKAAREAAESVAEHSDPEWFSAALDAIKEMPVGRQFMAEEVVCALREKGITTPDARAAGAVVRAAKSHGLIVSVGWAPAESSNGSPKTLWCRS